MGQIGSNCTEHPSCGPCVNENNDIVRETRLRRRERSDEGLECLNLGNIAYVSDVEGHWPFFCSFVEASEGLYFLSPGDHSQDNNFDDCRLGLKDGWHFVFGGDSCDKGPGTLRFLHAITDLKKHYGKRVHLILGNRDINKMRWTSELAQSELDRIDEVPRAFWLPSKCKTHAQFLRTLAAEKDSKEESTINLRTSKHNTKANKLRYLLDLDMGSAGEFEFRRQELKHMNLPYEDDDVAWSYENSLLKPEGLMRQYLEMAQLGILLGRTLFVHGQIIGNQFPPDQVEGADSSSTACCIGVVPGRSNPKVGCSYDFLPALSVWLDQLNAWARAEISMWKASPFWTTPPTEATYEAWRGRMASELIAYGTPGTRVPTVVYCRYLSEDSMPLQYPHGLVQYLKSNGVRNVVVGHTPHGNAPTVIQHDNLAVVMADCSFSHMKSNKYFQGDNRGSAVAAVCFNEMDGTCHVRGRTQEGQQIDYEIGGACSSVLGKFVHNQLVDKTYFVKARILPADWPVTQAQYLISNIKGFAYEYQLLELEELNAAMTNGSWKGNVSERACAPQDFLTHKERIAKIFDLLPTDTHNKVPVRKMLEICTDPMAAAELRDIFPHADLLSCLNGTFHTSEPLMVSGVKEVGGTSLEEFERACEKSQAAINSGMYFPIVRDQGYVHGTFPESLSPFKSIPTEHIRPRHVKLEMRQRLLSSWKTSTRETELDVEIFSDKFFSQVLGDCLRSNRSNQLSDLPPIKSMVSCARNVNVSDAMKESLNIPLSAKYFVYCYPFLKSFGWASAMSSSEVLKNTADVQFLFNGGFIYMDKNRTPVQINAAVPCPEGSLRFGPPQPLDRKWLKAQSDSRFQAVTLPFLLEKGARKFCWIEPERREGKNEVDGAPRCELGGFAYVMNSNRQIF